jgi:hypothetical protein
MNYAVKILNLPLNLDMGNNNFVLPMHCARILITNIRAGVVAAATVKSTIFKGYDAVYSGKRVSTLVQLRIRMCALGELLAKYTLKFPPQG